MVASTTLQANYNNKQKVKFENKLELKLGFQTSSGDTLHNFKTTEDLIRYTGKLGLQASKNWYYTLQLIAYTQFMRGYKSNDPEVYSDILSPLNINLSLGMSYSVNAFNGKLTGSLQVAPIAYNFRYVGRKSLATRYGLEEGSHTMNDVEATPVYHRIKSGDTLGAIAKRYGTSVSKLCELNGITKTTVLRLGRSLRCS